MRGISVVLEGAFSLKFSLWQNFHHSFLSCKDFFFYYNGPEIHIPAHALILTVHEGILRKKAAVIQRWREPNCQKIRKHFYFLSLTLHIPVFSLLNNEIYA